MKKTSALTILVVEDEPLTGKVAASFLEQYGAVILTADAREASANYIVQAPDIIFLDIHYSHDELNGFDVLKNFLSADANAFVVMFSSDHNEAVIKKAFELGAKGFIAKPFRAYDFIKYIDKLKRSA